MSVQGADRLDRATAEYLLSGGAAASSPSKDLLADVLAAAAAPATEGELAGEETALVAFSHSRLSAVRRARNRPTLSRLVKLGGAKLAAMGLAASAAGGTAFAASGVLPNAFDGPSVVPPSVSPSTPSPSPSTDHLEIAPPALPLAPPATFSGEETTEPVWPATPPPVSATDSDAVPVTPPSEPPVDQPELPVPAPVDPPTTSPDHLPGLESTDLLSTDESGLSDDPTEGIGQ